MPGYLAYMPTLEHLPLKSPNLSRDLPRSGIAESKLSSIPGGTDRNFASYGHQVAALSDNQRAILCDPQTSGGLLVAVSAESEAEVQALLRQQGINDQPIGCLVAADPANTELVQLVTQS